MLTRITGPSEEPVSLATAKSHLVVEHAYDDALIADYLAAARDIVEAETRRRLVTQTWDAHYDGWQRDREGRACLPSPLAPVASVSGVYYLDVAGAEQTLSPASYLTRSSTHSGSTTTLRPGVAEPALYDAPGSVRVRLVLGYGAAPAVPKWAAQAILLLVGTWYATRESVVVGTIANAMPDGVSRLLSQGRWRRYG